MPRHLLHVAMALVPVPPETLRCSKWIHTAEDVRLVVPPWAGAASLLTAWLVIFDVACSRVQGERREGCITCFFEHVAAVDKP
jgi:hypothetical protein